MSKISTLVEQITSKEYIEADKLFEQLMAEKVSAGIAATTAIINENMMGANPDLFVSPVDQMAALDHAPVEADHSERTDEIEVPDPIDMDGSHEGHPDEDEQKIMSEDAYAQFSESHDFEADEDEQEQHPENVAAVPVGAPAEHNQATQAMSPSAASSAQIEESHDGAMCAECGGAIMAEEEHVCEAHDGDHLEEEDEEHLEEKKGDGRNMNRLGTTLGGMAIGGTLGSVAGGLAGAGGVAAAGMTNPQAAGNVAAGAAALGNVVGSTVGAAQGWKQATKQNKAMYKEEDTEMEEELTDKQKKIDLNNNGKVDGQDLAKLREE